MPQGEWQPPESGDAPEGVKKILKGAYSSCRDKWAEEHPDDIENKDSKERCAKIAWAAVRKAGWSQDDDGKWHKQEETKMNEIKVLLSQLVEMYNGTRDWKVGDRRKSEETELLQDIHDLTTVFGAKHKDGTQKEFKSDDVHPQLIQNIHDHAIELGVECIGIKPKSEKEVTESKGEESLDDKVNKIRNAFYERFNKPEPTTSIWIREIFEDTVVADAGEDGLFRIGYTTTDDGIEFEARDKWQQVEQEYVPVEAKDVVVVSFGTEVKMKENGRYGEWLVKFSNDKDVDVTGDFFDKTTDFGFAGTIKSPVYLHHCLPVKTGEGVRRITQAIGEAVLTLNEEGVAIDAELYDWLAKSHDAYVARIAKTIKAAITAGKMGWSSGTAPHLVHRTKTGEAYHIDKWPLGLDATITPMPAGIKQGVAVVEIKSVTEAELEEPETGAETDNGVPVVAKEGDSQATQETYTMDDVQKIVEAVKTAFKAEQDAAKAAEEKAKQDKESRKAEILDILKELKGGKITNAGAVKSKCNGPGPGAQHDKTEYGDDAFKAFRYWLTHDNAGDVLRDLDAERENADMLDPGRWAKSIKTDYNFLGDTQYQGAELVPAPVYAAIRELRDKASVARLAGASNIPVSAITNYVPIEKDRTGKFVITSQGSEFDDNTVQLLDKATLTIYDFTRTVTMHRSLLADSVAPIEQWWNRHVARAEAVTENYYFVSVGTGSSQPKAALVGGASGKTAASQTAVTAAELIALYHSVPQQYRNRLAFIATGTNMGTIRGLAAAYGFSFIPTPAGTLNGGSDNGGEWIIAPTCRAFEEDNMPAMTAGLKPVLIGNFEEYLIGDREALSVFRDPYSRAKYGEVAFHCFFRRGGTTWTNEAFKYLTMAS